MRSRCLAANRPDVRRFADEQRGFGFKQRWIFLHPEVILPALEGAARRKVNLAFSPGALYFEAVIERIQKS